MRYEKKNLFIFLAILMAVLRPVHASILDQAQEQSDLCWFVICPDWLIAQTFTAGMSGQLEKVDLYLTNNMFYSPNEDNKVLYPCTVSIVNVIDGVPSGSILGEVYTGPLVDGSNSVNFLSESVFLATGVQYGIVITNDDAEKYMGDSTQWCTATTDVYAGGSAWIWMPDSGWVQSVQPPDESLPLETFYDKDAAFKTYMVPEPESIIMLSLCWFVLLKNRKRSLYTITH